MLSSPRRTEGGLGEDGYASVAAAGFAAVLVLLCGAVAWHAGAVVAGAQAQRAADLAAAVGAYRLAVGEGPDASCAVATWVAEINDGELASCTIDGEDLIAEALVRGQSAQARAGPL